jgi:rhamnosyltransferase
MDAAHSLATVTVTFHPDPQLLCSQLAALPATARKVLVDNGTPEEEWKHVASELGCFGRVEVLKLGSNLGLAAALDAGMRHVAATGDERFVLLLDQDSEPEPGSVCKLAEAYETVSDGGRVRVGAVGPELRDPDTGLTHGFHVMSSRRWKRVFPGHDGPPLVCAGLNGSGTFMRLETWRALGGLDEALFIDHIDTEWSFRLLAAGYELRGIPAATFVHRMGNASFRFWLFGWRVWPLRSPLRHYYLFRNAVSLIRRGYVPLVWKVWCVAKLGLTLAVHGLFDRQCALQLPSMCRGIRDGFRQEPSFASPPAEKEHG